MQSPRFDTHTADQFDVNTLATEALDDIVKHAVNGHGTVWRTLTGTQAEADELLALAVKILDWRQRNPVVFVSNGPGILAE